MLRAVADDGEVLGDCADSLSVKEDIGARAVAGCRCIGKSRRRPKEARVGGPPV
jgi:hypothetical protein